MNDKDEIIEGLIRTKLEIIAERNLHSAMIQDELRELRGTIAMKFQKIKAEISERVNDDLKK